MADNQQIDHYDFINAPQFVDFDDLASHDDPQADRFFETHREEDDFMIPLDINNISPTVQLLYHTENDVQNDDENDDDNEHFSNEANKAAMAAGLEDVKIEYYASPQNQSTKILSQPSSAKKSFPSVYGTPLGASGYSSSGATSFHTPTGGEDKENVTPTASSAKKLKNELLTQTFKLDAMEDNGYSNGQRGILSERSTEADGQSLLKSYTSSPSVQTPTIGSLTESLAAKLDNLAIVSSDEEDTFAEYCMPKLQQEPVPQIPVEVEAPAEQCINYSTFNDNKLSFLGLPVFNENSNQAEQGNNDSYSDHGDVTLLCAPVMETIEGKDVPISPIHSHNSSDEDVDDDESAPIELRTPIRNILKRLDAELHMDLEHPNSERENDQNEPRCSILVAPSVGMQVHWNQESESLQHDIQMTNPTVEPRELNVSYKVGDLSMNLNEFTLTSDYNDGESDDEFFGVIMTNTASSIVPPRRSSSVGDLVTALEPKVREFTTYGYNPRLGITIPKTPDCYEPHEPHRVVTQEGQQPGCSSSSAMDAFSSNKNSCYFEIEPPKPSKSMRRVSSCSDLLKHHEIKRKPVASRKSVQKKLPTIPRTPEALKRSQKLANRSNISSSSHEYANHNRKLEVAGKGPSVADRLAAARSRQPMKGNHYVSMAEAMINYQKNTPDRFRSLPKGRMVPEKRSASCDARKRFSPSPAHSPDSNHRSRGDSFSSKTTKAANNGPVLPKKVELKATIPKPFNFGSTHRPKPVAVNEDVVDFKFKARPAPSKTHHENHTVKTTRQPLKVTLPMSPRFASDERLRERHQKRAHNITVTKSPESKQTRGRLQQKTSRIPTASFTRSHADEHKTTIAQPFSSTFEARQKDILRKKEEKIKQELERANKVPEFHANPVPKFPGKLPKKKPIETTHVEPFRLKSDERGAAYQEAFKLKLEGEEQQLKDLAVFYAQPADVIRKAPFEPERPTRLIEPQEFNLATVRRAAEREIFDEQLREREREEEEKKREEQEKLDEIQKLEDIERRRQMVHKAQPFKHPKAFQLKPSGKALTVPQSPAFSALPSERRVIKPQSPSTQ